MTSVDEQLPRRLEDARLGIRFLGHQFEQIDVTNELDAVAS